MGRGSRGGRSAEAGGEVERRLANEEDQNGCRGTKKEIGRGEGWD